MFAIEHTHETGTRTVAGEDFFPDQYLGTARFTAWRDDESDVTISLWDTSRTDEWGKSRLAYELREGDAVVFSGTDFNPSPLHAIDGAEAFASIAGFLSMQPGDTDDDYFANYTPEQLDFAERRGEEISCDVAEIDL